MDDGVDIRTPVQYVAMKMPLARRLAMANHGAIKAHRDNTGFGHGIHRNTRGRYQKVIFLSAADIARGAAIEPTDFKSSAGRQNLPAQSGTVVHRSVTHDVNIRPATAESFSSIAGSRASGAVMSAC